MDPNRYAALFAAESRDHLQQCNAHVLAWEQAPHSLEPVQGLFRSVHTLKGMAATMGFARLAGLAHDLESLLAAVRAGTVAASPDVVDLCFRALDRLEEGVGLALAGDDELLAVGDLRGALLRAVDAEDPAPAAPGRPAAAHPPPATGLPVRVRLRAGVAMPGARAALVLRRARELGEVSGVEPDPGIWMDDAFTGEFGFRLAGDSPEDLVRSTLAAESDVAEVLVGAAARAGPAEVRQVRVDLDRLDRLVGITGELVVARSRLLAVAESSGRPELEQLAHGVARLINDLQAQVFRTRMAPLREVFERFPRPVRDLARQLGKRVRLDLDDGGIELDRAILDELADPLLHLLRNAIDHGLETPDERHAAGKPEEGRIRLSARRDRASVVIALADDGRGIDRGAVLAKARAEGWAEGLDEGDLLTILARPGFSTAQQVTDVSGRGVGIDAVVHWVRRLGGASSLTSERGTGTTMTLRLPLTVAIMPALLVGVGDERYALPLSFVAETTRITDRATYRGAGVPVIDWLPVRDTGRPWRPGVVLEVSGRNGALAVDALLGQEDIVVGPLQASRGMPRWVNGATILADGRPVLIVDPAALVS